MSKRKKHGMYRTKLYVCYWNMKYRTENKNSLSYSYYGGRGIKREWKTFEHFCEDMYSSYKEHVRIHGEKNTTLDRIDTNGNYCKENCRWATLSTQQSNKRSNMVIDFNGQKRTATEWSRITGIPYKTLYARIRYYGWTAQRALSMM